MESNMQIDKNCDRCWYDAEGKLHREDGPAIEGWDGSNYWYHHGVFHRENGPAVEYISGNKLLHVKRWYYRGKMIDCSSQKEFERLIKVKAFW
jgi:hypothetical protein